MASPPPTVTSSISIKRTPTDENKGRRQLFEASTRRVWGKRNPKSSDVPPGLESVGTTEREATHFYFERHFGNPIYSRLKDVEAQASSEDAAVPEASSEPDYFENHESIRVTEMEIMHNWMQELQDENLFVATINVLKEPPAQQRSSGRVYWIHLETPLPSLDFIEEVFHARIKHMLKPYVKETTISLLHRIRTDCERNFILGKYLNTDVVRYSARSVETDNKDHPCIFLNFPFLAKGDFETPRADHTRKPRYASSPKKSKDASITHTERHRPHHQQITVQSGNEPTISEKLTKRFSFKNRNDAQTGKEFHPARTLFQSRYRLESTAKRDKQQAILSLPLKDLQDCVQLPKSQATISPTDTGQAPSNQQVPSRSSTKDSAISLGTKAAHKRQKLYIPQLWSLSLSGDIMLTCGPLSLDQLCGSELTRKDYNTTSSKSRHKVVRFNVENDFGKNEEFIYPADRCDWYFGLLNKQRKIEDLMGKVSHVQLTQNRKGTCPFFYSIVYRKTKDEEGETVNCENWLQIQSTHAEDYLDLYLENHTLPIISATNTDATADNTPGNAHLQPNHSLQRQAAHIRSLSAPTSAAVRHEILSPRLLLEIPLTRPARSEGSGASDTPRTRSVSPISFSIPEEMSFFEWPFYEEVNENVNYSKERRVQVWLAKIDTAVCKLHARDIHPSLLRDSQQRLLERMTQLRSPIEGSDLQQIETNFFQNGSSIIRDGSTAESAAAQKVHSRATALIKLFMPESVSKITTGNTSQPSAKLIFLYWGLILRVLQGIAQKRTGEGYGPKDLAQTFQTLVDLARRVHRGVWRMKDGMDNSKNVTLVDSAIIQVPLIRVFERIFDLLFTIIATMEESKPPTVTETVASQVKALMDEFESVEDNLTQEADENRYQKGLGPIVTPESITLLLLNRLSQGVYSNGTINVIEVYERIVERLAYKVESSSSRLLLLEINRVLEEVDIILDSFKQQKAVLNKYKYYLNPEEIKEPSLQRKTRFVHEKVGIERLERDIEERAQHCSELRDRIKLLAEQNLQRVEAYQEDNNNKLMLFTVVTVTFLPPSFVTSFLGMNVVGVRDTTDTAAQFWKIATPLTVGLLIVSLVVLYLNKIKRYSKKLMERFASDEAE